MKPGWSNRKLIDVATLQRGFDLPSQDRIAGAFPLVSSSGIIDTHATKAVTAPGVVTGRSGSIGNVFYIEDDFWPLNTTLYVKDFHGNDPRFVYHLLMHFDLRQFASGTGVPTLNRNSVHEEMVMVPPLPEQQRIVAILDEAFAAIATAKANAEKNLQNARAVFERHLETTFSRAGADWRLSSVSELAEHSLGKMLDKVKNRGSMKPYLRNINVRWFTFDLSDLLEMPFLESETSRYSVRKGDVVICEGGYPGRAAIWMADEPIHFQKALHRVRFREPEYRSWFLYYLYSQERSGALRRHFTGTGIQHFTGEALAKLQVPVPPKAHVQRLEATFEALQSETLRLESLYRRKLAALDELKKCLLHRAFNGGL